MAIDQATLAELRRLWLETDERPAAIAARFGLSHQSVVLAARRGGWGPRPLLEAADRARKANRHDAGARTETASVSLPSKPSPARSRPSGRQDFVARLYGAIDMKLQAIEERMTSDEPTSPADTERDVRALGTLIRNIEKLHEFDDQLSRGRPGQGSSAPTSPADAERRRQELAQRIERLLAGRGT
jgi:hypothetical protein